MEPAANPKLDRTAFVQSMRQRFDAVLAQVADAVNDAAPGRIIAGSEETVRDLFAKLRQETFEQAVQMRVDAAEAAFPPSEGSGDAQDQTQ